MKPTLDELVVHMTKRELGKINIFDDKESELDEYVDNKLSEKKYKK